MPAKLKLTKPKKSDPAFTPERITVGNTRVLAALEHIARAREQLDAACRDLSDVYGASAFYRTLVDASNKVRDTSYLLEAGMEEKVFAAASSSVKADEPRHQSCGGVKTTGARY
jgi:hypothetical protein